MRARSGNSDVEGSQWVLSVGHVALKGIILDYKCEKMSSFLNPRAVQHIWTIWCQVVAWVAHTSTPLHTILPRDLLRARMDTEIQSLIKFLGRLEMLMYLSMMLWPLSFLRRDTVSSSCDFVTTLLTTCILHLQLLVTSEPVEKRTFATPQLWQLQGLSLRAAHPQTFSLALRLPAVPSQSGPRFWLAVQIGLGCTSQQALPEHWQLQNGQIANLCENFAAGFPMMSKFWVFGLTWKNRCW